MGRMSEAKRLFFALWPDEALRAGMLAAAEALRLPMKARTRPHHLHITLVFLGRVEAAAQACLMEGAHEVAGEGFMLVLDEIQHRSRRQLLWLQPRAAPPALDALVSDLQSLVQRCGLRCEERAYHPHVTLARRLDRRPAGAPQAPIFWAVREFVLVESIPGEAGSEYRVLHSWPLATTS